MEVWTQSNPQKVTGRRDALSWMRRSKKLDWQEITSCSTMSSPMSNTSNVSKCQKHCAPNPNFSHFVY